MILTLAIERWIAQVCAGDLLLPPRERVQRGGRQELRRPRHRLEAGLAPPGEFQKIRTSVQDDQFKFAQASTMVFIFVFSLGVGPLPWVINGEIYPEESKGKYVSDWDLKPGKSSL